MNNFYMAQKSTLELKGLYNVAMRQAEIALEKNLIRAYEKAMQEALEIESILKGRLSA